jgi:hypothetical protein
MYLDYHREEMDRGRTGRGGGNRRSEGQRSN